MHITEGIITGDYEILSEEEISLFPERRTVPEILESYGIDPKEYENKLVYLMSVDKARFRNPVIPDCELHLEIEAIRSHGRVWKYKGTAKVNGKRMADAEWSATIVNRK